MKNYQKVQKLPKMIQTKLNQRLSERPRVQHNQSSNYLRQQYIDVIQLHKHNQKLAAREYVPRMDREDRLKYIREQKQKLGLHNRELLVSTRRTIIDGEHFKNLPSLDFHGHRRTEYSWLKPHEMHWSL